MKDGSRKIVEISEVVGMESDVVTLQTIYQFQLESYDNTGKALGHFRFTGIRPRVVDKMEDHGIHALDSWFA